MTPAENAAPAKTAVVTGGASGIGLAVVRTLLEEGWSVVVADAARDALARAEAELTASPALSPSRLSPSRPPLDRAPLDRLSFRPVDVTDEPSVERLFRDLAAAGASVRGLVNSAGIGVAATVFDTSAALFRRAVDINLTGTFLMSREAARGMVAAPTGTGGGTGAGAEAGAIVNIGSVLGIRGGVERAAYGASKGGVANLTRSMAVELAPFGVRVNAVLPGPIETPMVAALHAPAVRAAVMASIPLHRYGRPEDIAAAVAFLLDGRRSGFVTGQLLAADGGLSADLGLALAAG